MDQEPSMNAVFINEFPKTVNNFQSLDVLINICNVSYQHHISLRSCQDVMSIFAIKSKTRKGGENKQRNEKFTEKTIKKKERPNI